MSLWRVVGRTKDRINSGIFERAVHSQRIHMGWHGQTCPRQTVLNGACVVTLTVLSAAVAFGAFEVVSVGVSELGWSAQQVAPIDLSLNASFSDTNRDAPLLFGCVC